MAAHECSLDIAGLEPLDETEARVVNGGVSKRCVGAIAGFVAGTIGGGPFGFIIGGFVAGGTCGYDAVFN
jgi:hypothetical protein